MKATKFFAVIVMVSLMVATPSYAQKRKDRKAAEKAAWDARQQFIKDSTEIANQQRLDSIANAPKRAAEKAAAEEKARKEAAKKAEAERHAAEAEAKAEAKRQAAEKAAQEVDFIEPCMDANSTDEYIRARGIGESLQHQSARTKAQTFALRDLAAKTGLVVKSVLIAYINDETTDMMTDEKSAVGMYVEDKTENMVKQIVRQNLSGYSTPCDTTRTYMKNNKKIFKCYMVVQAGKEDVLKPVYDAIQKDNTIRLNLDYGKFEEKFEEELEKIEKQE